jgi:hypothetical protein
MLIDGLKAGAGVKSAAKRIELLRSPTSRWWSVGRASVA